MNIYIHEHLFRWLKGQASFTSPDFFYPQRNVLGFTDASLLDLPLYAVLRSLGFEPFLSYQLLVIALSLACYASAVIILTRFLKVQIWIAVAAALLITFPNNLIFKVTVAHNQFFSLYYIPPIALLALWSIKDFPRLTFGSFVCAALAGFLYALLFATAFYSAWMFALTCLIAIVFASIRLRHQIGGFVIEHRKAITTLGGGFAAGFAIGLIPFALIYGPALALVPGRTYREYMGSSPSPLHIINVSSENLIWGSLVQWLFGANAAQSSELALAITPGIVAALLVMTWIVIRRDPNPTAAHDWTTNVFIPTCIAVWVASCLLMFRIGTFSGYWLLYHLVPGATAIRAGGRIQLYANMWLVCGLAVVLDRWVANSFDQAIAWKRGVVTAAILLFGLAEQLTSFRKAGVMSSTELARIAATPSPPSECRMFFVDQSYDYDWQALHEAMLISQAKRLPTFNGMSGWGPTGWRFYTTRADTFPAARDWIAQNKITEQVCFYERATQRWSAFPPR